MMWCPRDLDKKRARYDLVTSRRQEGSENCAENGHSLLVTLTLREKVIA
jgi:hypothetical protein